MKRCQKCSRTFPDENQKFCTFDGGLLLTDQPTFDPNRTILAPQMDSFPRATPPTPSAPIQAPPPAQPGAPERDMSETMVAFRPPAAPETPPAVDATTALTGGPTTPDLVPPVAQTSRDLVAPVPPADSAPNATFPYAGETMAVMPPVPTSEPSVPPPPAKVVEPPLPPPPPPVQQAPPPPVQQAPPPPVQPPPPPVHQAPPEAAVPQPPPAPPVKPVKKRSIVPWIIGILVVLFLGVAGLAVAGYVFQDQIREFINKQGAKGSPTPTPANSNSNANANSNTNTNANSGNTNSSGNTNNVVKEVPAYVPPADSVQFSNSKDGLDGDLAAHYVGFSFYYPKTWTKDPKAGVAGASNFAKVDRQFSDSTGDFIQERALFNWYPSKGTYETDQGSFPEYAKKFTDQLAKGLPGYEEVSRGETTVNAYKAFEVRFKGEFKQENKTLPYWGRVILVPPGVESEKAGVAIVMLATSYAPGVGSAADVGIKGELAMILDSFRFAPKQ